MSGDDTVIVVPGDGGDAQGATADFAAGVATATAAQASEDAAEALAGAELAAAVAGSAEETAWDARVAVDELRSELAGIRDRLDAQAATQAAVVDVVAEVVEEQQQATEPETAPEKKETQAAAVSDDKPRPKAKRWGSNTWWGDR